MRETADSTAENAGAVRWKCALRHIDRLSPRERELFLLLADGPSNHELARRMHVSERTVRAHIAAVLNKLELESRMGACLASYFFGVEYRNSR